MNQWKFFKYFKYFLFFAFWFFSPEIFAGVFDVMPTDKSKQYLGIIFGGNVGAISLGGGSNPMLSKMFQYFNVIVLGIGVLILSWVGIVALVNTAREGEAMGKKFSLWVPLRGLFGMLLLIPSPGSGYSLIQMTVMWIVLNGIGAANAVWTIVLNQLALGVPSVGNIPINISNGQLDGLARSILMAETCMNSFNQFKQSSLYQNYGPVRIIVTAQPIQYSPNANKPTTLTQSAIISVGVPNPGNPSTADPVLGNLCGSFTVTTSICQPNTDNPNNNICLDTFNLASVAQRLNFKVGALLAMFNVISPAATSLASGSNPANGFFSASYDAYRSGIAALAGGVNMAVAQPNVIGSPGYVPPTIKGPGNISGPTVGYSINPVTGLPTAAGLASEVGGQAQGSVSGAQTTGQAIENAGFGLMGEVGTNTAATVAAPAVVGAGVGALATGAAVQGAGAVSGEALYGAGYVAGGVGGLASEAGQGAANLGISGANAAIGAGSTVANKSIEAGTNIANQASNFGVNTAQSAVNTGYNIANYAVQNWEQQSQVVPVTQTQVNNLLQVGWIHAGSYYYSLSQSSAQNPLGNELQNIPSPLSPIPNQAAALFPGNPPQEWSSAVYNQLGSDANRVAFNNALTNANQYYLADHNFTPATTLPSLGSGQASTGNQFMDQIVNALSASFRQPIMDFIQNELMGTGSIVQGSIDPLVTIGRFGWTMMVAAEISVFVVIALCFTLLLALAAGSCLSPMAWAINALAMQIFGMVFAVMVLLWTAGATLGVYTPLIPYIIFTTTAVGWFLVVAEALVGSPIIALALVQPGGEELGNIKEGLGLVANVFIRPTLMIFGFILASGILRGALTLINFGFMKAVNDSVLPTVFSIIPTIGIYTFLVVGVVNQAFGLIYELPNKIMSYMGLRHEGFKPDTMIGEAKRGFESGAAVGKAGVQAMSEKGLAAYGKMADKIPHRKGIGGVL